MLARLLAFGRPATGAVSRAAGVPGLDISLAFSSQASLASTSFSRDAGHDASTSYGGSEQPSQASNSSSSNQHHKLILSATQRRSYGTLNPAAASARLDAHASSGGATVAVTTDSADTGDDDAVLRGLDMESLMRVLLHPVPLGSKHNMSLLSGAAAPVVQLGREALFFDPTHTLSSTMRALHVIRRTLRDDGHVLIVNPNPVMRPLMREAAYLSLNRNVWFWYRDWQPGMLADTNRSMAAVLDPHYCQPNRRLMAARGLVLRNPLCPPGSLEYNARHPAPKLSDADVKQLEAARRPVSRQRRDRELAREHRQVLDALAAARAREAKLLPAGVQPAVGRGGHSERLALVVALDLSYGGDAVREAAERKIPTVSLLNGHSDATHVTFPVYASESHAGFQHFFLDWVLRLVNLPTPPGQPQAPGARA